MSEDVQPTEAISGWTKRARRFTIWGAAVLMLIALIGFVWAGFRKVEVYISLPVRLDRVEVKLSDIDKNVKTILDKVEE